MLGRVFLDGLNELLIRLSKKSGHVLGRVFVDGLNELFILKPKDNGDSQKEVVLRSLVKDGHVPRFR